MKILEVLNRNQRGKKDPMQIKAWGREEYDPKRPHDYFYEYRFVYDVNGGNFDQEYIEAHKRTDHESFNEVWEYIVDDNGIDKADHRMVATGENPIWAGYKLGEIESHTDEDEDGRYEYVSGEGQAWIVSTTPLSDDVVQRIADKLEDGLDKEAGGAIEDAHDARRDADEYARDPYAYYGLSRSDFM
jgi:hypothetical protein